MTETNAIDCSAAEGERRPHESSVQPAANSLCVTCGTDALQLAAYDDVFWCPECGTLLGDYGPWVPKRIKALQVEHGSETRSAG